MSSAPDRVRLCVFARAPVLGEVKRRLAAQVGAAAALNAYLTLAEDTFERLAVVDGAETELWLAGPVTGRVRHWQRRWQLPLRRQQGGDLGQRMAHALACCHDAGCAGLVVGTDCPPVDAAYVHQAVEAMKRADVVLGPAEDGGYALVGCRTPVPEIFKEVPWGTPAVLATSLERAHRAGLSVHLLGTVWDVDSADDLARMRVWTGSD